jgi:hypothetical protein
MYLVRQQRLCTLKCWNLWRRRVSHRWQNVASVIMSTPLPSSLAFGPLELLPSFSSSPPRRVSYARPLFEASIFGLSLFFQCSALAVLAFSPPPEDSRSCFLSTSCSRAAVSRITHTACSFCATFLFPLSFVRDFTAGSSEGARQ